MSIGIGRRELIAAIGGSVFAWPLWVRAQTNRAHRIGILETIPQSQNLANFNALRDGLRQLNYVEGRNLVLEYRSADGRADRFTSLAAELVQLGVDLIVTRGTPAAQAAKKATTTIPIVMAAIGEPLGVGVVATLAHPGGNVTGLSAFVTELAGKRVEIMKDMIPSISRVAFMNNMGNPVSPPQWEATKAVAAALGLSSELFDIRSEQDIAGAFAMLGDRKVDALSVGIDVVTQANAGTIVELALRHNIATAYPSREFVDAGGLVSYGVSYPDLYRRSAGLIDKIFKGARPSDIPVEQPTKLELVINLKIAKAIGLTIPESFLLRADEVIE
jgi:putative tryptophan/tyrosine transport system substrate-binding protein